MFKRSRFSPAFQISTRQWVWGIVGLVSLVFIAVVTSADLHKIYQVQPDFILGAFLSVASFCFAKASTRTNRDRALEELHRTGVIKEVYLARRNALAARERLGDFFHSQAESHDFLAGLDLYEVISNDVQAALANIDLVIQRLPGDNPLPGFTIPESQRQVFLDRARDVREALRRGENMRRWLATRRGDAAPSQAEQIFDVLVSDLLKAYFALHELCEQPPRVAPADRLTALRGYLTAASARATELAKELERQELPTPEIFAIMIRDLASASDSLPTLAGAAPHTGDWKKNPADRLGYEASEPHQHAG